MTATTTGNGRTRSGGRSRTAKGNTARRVHARAHARNESTVKKWSKHVTETSDAMDLEHDVFKTGDAEAIAASLKRSASKSHRRKGSPFQSAMSMLNFYTNRAGRNLSKSRKQTLQDAKKKLREAFGRAP
ncbi:MAG TPA: DUF3175 domain-containing protein [Herbaspirillum sp.]